MEEKARSREELVESGSFGIDRTRALEKLAKFQLENPLDAVLLLARAAVGSGATKLQCSSEGERDLVLEWDGNPLAGSFLASPYDALFEYEGPDGPRLRQIATALLALTRIPRVSAAIESGNDRCGVDAQGETLSRLEKPVTGIRITIRFQGPSHRQAALDRLSSKTALYPIQFSIDGIERPPFQSSSRRMIDFHERGFSGDFQRDNLRPAAALDIYKQGVYVERVVLEGFHWVHARIEASDLPLDLSQGGAMRGERFEECVEAAKVACGRLIPNSTRKMNAATHYGARFIVGTTMALASATAGFAAMWWFLGQDSSSTLYQVLAGTSLCLGYGGMILMEPILDRLLGKKFE